MTEFLAHPQRVLEEYYHVTKQWNTGRLSEAWYLLESGRAWLSGEDAYSGNVFEREAKGFAQSLANQRAFEYHRAPAKN